MAIIPEQLKSSLTKVAKPYTVSETAIVKEYGSLQNKEEYDRQVAEQKRIQAEVSSFTKDLSYENYEQKYNSLSPQAKAVVTKPQELYQTPEYRQYQSAKAEQARYANAINWISRKAQGKRGGAISKEDVRLIEELFQKDPSLRRAVNEGTALRQAAISSGYSNVSEYMGVGKALLGEKFQPLKVLEPKKIEAPKLATTTTTTISPVSTYTTAQPKSIIGTVKQVGSNLLFNLRQFVSGQKAYTAAQTGDVFAPLKTPEFKERIYGGQPKVETTLFGSGEVRLTPTTVSSMGGKGTDVTLTGLPKEITTDYSRGIVRKGIEFIPSAGIVKALDEPFYVPDKLSYSKAKLLLESTSPGAGYKLTNFLREQQAQYKKDVAEYNTLLAMGKETNRLKELRIRLTEGNIGTGWDLIKESVESKEGAEKRKGRILAGTTKGLSTALDIEAAYLGYQLGGAAALGGASAIGVSSATIAKVGQVGTSIGKLYTPSVLVGAGARGVGGIMKGEYTPYVIGETAGTVFGGLAPYYGGKLATRGERLKYQKAMEKYNKQAERYQLKQEGQIQKRTAGLTQKFFEQSYKEVGIVKQQIPSDAYKQLVKILQSQGIPAQEAEVLLSRVSLGKQTFRQRLPGMRDVVSSRYLMQFSQTDPVTGQVKNYGIRFRIQNGKIASNYKILAAGKPEDTFVMVAEADPKTGKIGRYLVDTRTLKTVQEEGSRLKEIYSATNVRRIPLGEKTRLPLKELSKRIAKEETVASLISKRQELKVTDSASIFREVGRGTPGFPGYRLDRPLTTFEKVVLADRTPKLKLRVNKIKQFGVSPEPTPTPSPTPEPTPTKTGLIQQPKVEAQTAKDLMFKAIPLEAPKVKPPKTPKQIVRGGSILKPIDRPFFGIGSGMYLGGGLLPRTREREEDTGAYAGAFFTGLGKDLLPSSRSSQPEAFKIAQPIAQVTQPITTTPMISTPTSSARERLPPREPIRPTKPLPAPPTIPLFFPGEKKKTFGQPYDAQVLVESTKRGKTRWVQVADNVPLITAKSRGASFVDENASNQFRVVPQKGKMNQVIDTAWNTLQSKFREYAQKGGVKVGLKDRYIEKTAFRIDSPGERKQIPREGQASIGRRFGRL